MPTAAATYETIATTTLSTNSSEVDFTSIPGTYTDLVLVATVKWTGSGNSSWGLRFNSDSGTNYSITRFFTQSSSVQATGSSGDTATQTGQINSGNWSTNITQINGYAQTTFWKLALARATISTGTTTGIFLGRWNSTSAITSIKACNFDGGSGAFASGSVFSLYGIKVA